MKSTSLIYLGIKGSVLALSRSTGQEVWRTKLKSHNFVNIALDGELLYATTSGEIFCLAASTGKTLWHNPLKGLGFGIATIVGATITTATPMATIAAQIAQEQAASATTTSAGAAAT